MNTSTDRISSLPDEVLTHILSFMSTKKAVQMCILAKRWRNIWKSVPVLYFYLNEFWEKKQKWDDDYDYDGYGSGDGDGDGSGDGDEDDEEWVISEDQFIRFVNGVLKNKGPSNVNKVIYNWTYETHEAVLSPYDCDPPLGWLHRVALLMPREIMVHIDRAFSLRIPHSVFSSASLEKLVLSIYSDGSLIAPKCINLPSLRYLVLDRLQIEDNFVQILLPGCPVLESVKLSFCILDISVISSDVLRKLVFKECRQYQPLRICCPALVSLSIANFSQDEDISLQNLVSLVNAYISLLEMGGNEYLPPPTLNLLGGLSNVTCLKLYIPCPELKKQLEMDIPNCRIFNNLKSLEIGGWDMITSIDLVVCFLKNSPNLQELTLQLKNGRGDAHEVPREDVVGDDLFQLEYLATLKIISARKERADNLVNLLGQYLKAIGNIIVDTNQFVGFNFSMWDF